MPVWKGEYLLSCPMPVILLQIWTCPASSVVPAVVKTGGQAVKYLDKIRAEAPRRLLDA